MRLWNSNMFRPIRVARILAFLVLSSAICYATAIVSTTGSFTADDDQVFFNFSLLAPTTVTMQTWSFAGGTNATGQVIAPGGFFPVLSLFDATGSQPLLASDTGGTAPSNCGVRNIDPVTGFCLDSYLSLSLAAGSYSLYLTQFDNLPIGPDLSNGFLQQGNGNFTGGPFFLNAGTGFQRTGNWAVDITTAAAPAVPEPSTAAVTIFGLSIFTLISALRR